MTVKKSKKRVIGLFITALVLSGVLCFAQTDYEISLSAMYPIYYGSYNQIRAPRFRDRDSIDKYVLDPSGTSTFDSLYLRPQNANSTALWIGDNLGSGGRIYQLGQPAYYIYLNDSAGFNSSGAVRLKQLRTRYKIFLGRGATGQDYTGQSSGLAPITGKHVYDVAEAIRAVDCEPCDVVVVSQSEDMTVVKSSHKYDNKIAGVISEDASR